MLVHVSVHVVFVRRFISLVSNVPGLFSAETRLAVMKSIEMQEQKKPSSSLAKHKTNMSLHKRELFLHMWIGAELDDYENEIAEWQRMEKSKKFVLLNCCNRLANENFMFSRFLLFAVADRLVRRSFASRNKHIRANDAIMKLSNSDGIADANFEISNWFRSPSNLLTLWKRSTFSASQSTLRARTTILFIAMQLLNRIGARNNSHG